MGGVVYTKLPPVMAAIKDGDIEALRALLDAGHAPDEPQRYLWQCGNMEREGEAAPLELAVLEQRQDMAELLHCTDRHYQRIEYGEVNLPSLDLLFLADYFGVSVDYLLGRTDNPEVNR